MPNIRTELIATDANASLISQRSMSSGRKPAFSSALSEALAGVRARYAKSSATSAAKGAAYRNRIFTVGGEIPFAGHPSLGTAVAVAAARGEKETTYVQETGVGLQPIDVRLDEDGGYASMLQEPATFGPEVDPPHVLAAIGLGERREQQGQLDVLVRREHGDQVIELKHESDVSRAPAGQLRLAEFRDVGAGDRDLTLVGAIDTRDQIEERGLSRSGRAHQAEELSLGDVERNVVQHRNRHAVAPVGLGHTANLNDRNGHNSPLTAR